MSQYMAWHNVLFCEQPAGACRLVRIEVWEESPNRKNPRGWATIGASDIVPSAWLSRNCLKPEMFIDPKSICELRILQCCSALLQRLELLDGGVKALSVLFVLAAAQ